ncbi:MAG TPA: phosphoenolpyruvate carboxykinase (ATP) [Chloroflexi bacterium]|nr:phosphoenolpyruvate carboxykinase (ATP) [Chloroflexota bacterium]
MIDLVDLLDALNNRGLRYYYNLHSNTLANMSVSRGETQLLDSGAILLNTSPHTGRAAKDRFLVRNQSSLTDVHWSNVNKPVENEQFDLLINDVKKYLCRRDLFIVDRYVCADESQGLKVRFVLEMACHALFVNNMFLDSNESTIETFNPDITVFHAPLMNAVNGEYGLRSGTAVEINLDNRIVVIVGTLYSGEIKKSVFSLLNYILPKRSVLPMHCSANIGSDGDTALFFGLSGTGKTTLSADKKRRLIGDDEHGWGENGVFNLEGGCYAKVINISNDNEPEICAAINKPDVLLENVDMSSGIIDFTSSRITENTRASYPVDYMSGFVASGSGGHPQNIFFLSADAFGVLPPISRLTVEQTIYYFLSGYTSKLAGVEQGIVEPEATFSPCFSEPFLVFNPIKYAEMLMFMINSHNVSGWLVNTGWHRGEYGEGTRIDISVTRSLIDAVLTGKIDNVEYMVDPVFGLHVPLQCSDVDEKLLIPRELWGDKHKYDKSSYRLACAFEHNFRKYQDEVSDDIRLSGPQV